MKSTKLKLKQIIKEVLNERPQMSDKVWDAHKVAIENIRNMSKQMNDKDSYAFLNLLKEWFNKNVLEEKEEKNNPWAICTASVGRKDKEKYESCVKKVKGEKR